MGFASASVDNIFKVREVATGRKLRTATGYGQGMSSIALNADGRLAVSASHDQTLKVWDISASLDASVATGRELRTLHGHSGKVQSVALSGDGRLAVSASSDTTLRVWDVATGQIVSVLLTSAPLTCCAMTPDGRTIIAGDSIGVVHFLEWVSGGEIPILETAKKQPTTKTTKKSRRAQAGGGVG